MQHPQRRKGRQHVILHTGEKGGKNKKKREGEEYEEYEEEEEIKKKSGGRTGSM